MLSMRMLLNAIPEELERLGEDFTLYGDWLRLTRPGMTFQLISASRVRQESLAFRISKSLARSFLSWRLREAWCSLELTQRFGTLSWQPIAC